MNPKFLVVDLFCGAGGTTTGFEKARIGRKKIAKVIACVNHDAFAISSHRANHKGVLHFTEDIRTLDLRRLIAHVNRMRALYPNAKLVLWASLECTNFSRAKGGQPRDADSRTLAEHLFRYIEALQPDYIDIENVEEFMSWGPLFAKVEKTKEGYEFCRVEFVQTWETIEEGLPIRDESGLLKANRKQIPGKIEVRRFEIPSSKHEGEDFIRWVNAIKRYGYNYEHRLLNSADYGAYTSRVRYFATFARPELPIVWPEPTHAKNPQGGSLFGGASLRKWKPVREVLDLEDEGKCIFERKKKLSPKTLQRILAGCIKYVAGGKEKHEAFVMKMNSGNPSSMCVDPNGPTGALTTKGHQALTRVFMLKYNSMSRNGVHTPPSVDDPYHVVPAQNRLGVAQVFMVQRNSGDPNSKIFDTLRPARTITGTGGNQDIVQAHPAYLVKFFSANSGRSVNSGASGDEPAPTVAATRTPAAVFLAAYHGNGHNIHATDKPASVVAAADALAMKQIHWLDSQFGSGYHNHSSIEAPAGSLPTTPKKNLIGAFLVNHNYDNTGTSVEQPAPTLLASRKHYYIVNPSWGGNNGDVQDPCCTVVARQDKAPLYLVATEQGDVAIAVWEDDCETTIQIKEFMAMYGIARITMRMLKVVELKLIMGLPADYVLNGPQGKQKWMIGNMVHPEIPRHMARVRARALEELERRKAA